MKRRLLTALKWLVFLAVLGWGGYAWWSQRPIRHGPGRVAPHPPRQSSAGAAAPITLKGFTLTPVALFDGTLRVLGTQRYRTGRLAAVVPVDVAFGWGPMSDETHLEKITVRQFDRYYTWGVKEPPLTRDEIEHNSANMHLVAATDEIASQIKALRRGHVVTFTGYLVNVKGPGTIDMKSSTSRRDTGGGACENVYIRTLTVRGAVDR